MAHDAAFDDYMNDKKAQFAPLLAGLYFRRALWRATIKPTLKAVAQAEIEEAFTGAADALDRYMEYFLDNQPMNADQRKHLEAKFLSAAIVLDSVITKRLDEKLETTEAQLKELVLDMCARVRKATEEYHQKANSDSGPSSANNGKPPGT